MNTLLARALLFCVAVTFIFGVDVSSASEGDAKTDKKTVAAPDVIHASVLGRNFCLGCSLKKRKGAAAQCSVFGHKHSLRITSAKGKDGKELADLAGWVLHYLENEKSVDLIKKHHGATVNLLGIIYPTERVFEVSQMVPKSE